MGDWETIAESRETLCQETAHLQSANAELFEQAALTEFGSPLEETVEDTGSPPDLSANATAEALLDQIRAEDADLTNYGNANSNSYKNNGDAKYQKCTGNCNQCMQTESSQSGYLGRQEPETDLGRQEVEKEKIHCKTCQEDKIPLEAVTDGRCRN